MKIKGKVLNAISERRDLLGKDGVKQSRLVSSIVLLGESEDGIIPVYNCRTYSDDYKLPKIGSDCEILRIKKYECYNGSVAEVMF